MSSKDSNKPMASTHPLDLALARLQVLLDGLEKRREKDEAQLSIPDDVPRFVTGAE